MPALTIDPPQPTTAEYPLTALIPSFIHTFINQADYQTKTGFAAPAYDVSKPIKLWVDVSTLVSPTANITYTIVVMDATFQHAIVESLTLPGFIASAPNIPPDEGPTPVNPNGTEATPVRPLLPGEVLIASPFGISVENTNISPVPTSGLTPMEHAWLSRIFTLITTNFK